MNALARPGVLLGLLLVQLGIIAPHWSELPGWIFGFFIACGAFRYSLLRFGWRLPPVWLKLLLLALVLGGLAFSFRRLAGLDVAASFLILMQALKLLEAKDQRDAMIMVQLSYFLIATSFLFSQSLGMGIYLLLGVWSTTAILIGAQSSQGLKRLWPSFRLSGILVLQALPLMALLFVLFPRIPGPLWQMQDPSQAKTGLSDSMTPEDVAKLSGSPEIAFRVESPQGSQQLVNRYWRALTYGRFDGRRWTQLDNPTGALPAQNFTGPSLNYQITLEPSQQPWLIALDWPGQPPASVDGAQLQPDMTLALRGNQRVSNRLLYQLNAYPNAQLTQLSDDQRKLYTRLPNFGDKRSREWANNLRQTEPTDAGYLQALLRHIRQQPFYYDLEIETIESNTIDGFWLDRQRGFCAHYAGALSFLLRTVGIPTRVVAGYLGGDYNAEANYLIVRQLHAHAWVEVWLDGRWQRVDPTTAIDPSRIVASLSDLQQQRQATDTDVLNIERGLLERGSLLLDQMNYRWQLWVLSYDEDRQRELLEKLGLANWSWQQLLPLVTLGILLILGLLAWWLLPRRARPSIWQQSFSRLQRRLQAQGTFSPPRQPAELLQQAAAADPKQQRAWLELHQQYLALRYQPQPTPEQQRQWLAQFRRVLAEFNAKPHR